MSKDLSIKNETEIGLDQEAGGFKYFLPKLSTMRIPYGEHARQSLDGQLRRQPKDVAYCTKCVISNQRPRITFDDKGVCSACDYAEYKRTKVDWKKRKEEFEKLCDQFRRKDGRWDVVVPCSGGKDSGSLAYRLKYEFGMHPLCVTWSPLLYTHLGFQNFQNLILSGLDSHLASPNRLLQRKLARLCFVMQGDHFEAFSRGQGHYPFHVALKEGIKLIMWGENAELEYGGDTKNRDVPYNPIEDFDRYYYKNTSFGKLLKFGHDNGYLDDQDMKDPSLQWYDFPPLDEIKKAGIAIRWFAWYFNWIPQENYYYSTEHYNFQALPRRSEATYSKYASLDDVTDPFHFYLGLVKFGLGRTTSDAAHEIRDGHVTREEGVALVRRYDQEFPSKHFNDFLRYVDMSEEEFWQVVDAYRARSSHLWEKIDGEWKLKVQA